MQRAMIPVTACQQENYCLKNPTLNLEILVLPNMTKVSNKAILSFYLHFIDF
jgi:hypothetical protein